MHRITLFAFSLLFVSFTVAEEIRIVQRSVESPDTERWQVSVMVRSETAKNGFAPQFSSNGAVRIDNVIPQTLDLPANQWAMFHLEVSGTATSSDGKLEISTPETKTTVDLTPSIDLLALPWTRWFAGTGSTLAKATEVPKEAAWEKTTLPKLWDDLGVIWIRTEVFVPKHWESLPLRLMISAVDDNDRTFVNGKEIGRTNGWDTFRDYPIPKNFLRFGEKNEIVIAVENANAGGGIAAGPVQIGVKREDAPTVLFPKEVDQPEADRQPPRPQGNPLPLRPMSVRDGVLEYSDGGEVALWGVNYYPQSWAEFQWLKKQNVDIPKAINADLDDLLQDKDPLGPNRINAIRIHVFDTEISDGDGNLIRNEHLDLLDYLVDQCNKRGVNLWLTPIAWWGSPQGRADSFSQNIPMQAMIVDPGTWDTQARFMKQFLEHENPYTKRRLIDEPCLNLLEIINEPLHWSFAQLRGESPLGHGSIWVKKKDGEVVDDPNIRYRNIVRASFLKSLPSADWESNEAWQYYQYSMVRQYIDRMVQTIRDTGGRQPIAYNAWNWNIGPAGNPAIADSRCDAITYAIYPGGLTQTPQADAKNLLPQTFDVGWPKSLSKKARLVYEFDASDTLKQIDLYPAIARFFRNRGIQVACQFQYDSRFNAAHNQAWLAHYLNAVHTPERFVSFLIGGETFRTLPRGTRWTPTDKTEGIFPPTAVSYTKNAAILCEDHLYMQARPTDWKPLEIPVAQTPLRVVAVGSTPYFDYDGTGIVDLTLDGNDATLKLGDDVIRLRNDTLRGSVEEPLTRLEKSSRRFQLKIPGWPQPNGGSPLESGRTYHWKKTP